MHGEASDADSWEDLSRSKNGAHLFVLRFAGLHGELVGLAVEAGLPGGKGEEEEEGAKEEREAERALEQPLDALGDERRALAAQLLHLLPPHRRLPLLRLCAARQGCQSL